MAYSAPYKSSTTTPERDVRVRTTERINLDTPVLQILREQHAPISLATLAELVRNAGHKFTSADFSRTVWRLVTDGAAELTADDELVATP